MAFTRAMGGRAPADNLRVVGINPGPVMTERLVTLMKTRAQQNFGDENRWEERMKGHAFGRAAKPEEIAAMVAFVASDQVSGYTTGNIYTIDGGGSSRRSAFSGASARALNLASVRRGRVAGSDLRRRSRESSSARRWSMPGTSPNPADSHYRYLSGSFAGNRARLRLDGPAHRGPHGALSPAGRDRRGRRARPALVARGAGHAEPADAGRARHGARRDARARAVAGTIAERAAAEGHARAGPPPIITMRRLSREFSGTDQT